MAAPVAYEHHHHAGSDKIEHIAAVERQNERARHESRQVFPQFAVGLLLGHAGKRIGHEHDAQIEARFLLQPDALRHIKAQ